jgi:hypothetical protein
VQPGAPGRVCVYRRASCVAYGALGSTSRSNRHPDRCRRRRVKAVTVTLLEIPLAMALGGKASPPSPATSLGAVRARRGRAVVRPGRVLVNAV